MGNRNKILNKQSVNLKNIKKNDDKIFDTDDSVLLEFGENLNKNRTLSEFFPRAQLTTKM